MEKIIRNKKEINIFQYTQIFKDEIVSNGPDEFDDFTFIVISGMVDTEFRWDFYKKELVIVYSNFNNFYENVTSENYRQPEIINVGDYIIKEDDIYHIETKEKFEENIKNI